MGNLVVKEVEFNNDVLLVAQKKDSEKVYVAVRWVSEGIGLSEGQARRQIQNLKGDIVLKQGVTNLRLPTNSGEQETLCIELDYLPLWLAKISITPKMQENTPDVVGKLVDYQLKAKDVLANAFVHDVTQIVPKNYKEALLALIESIEEKEKLEEENLNMKPKVKIHDQLVASVNLVDMILTAKNIGVGEKKLFEFLRATKILFQQDGENVPYQRYQNKDYFKIKAMIKEDKHGRAYTYHTVKITGKGRVFIAELVNKYGGAEKINQLKLKDIKNYVENFNGKT